ncbi:MAG: cytochrome c oxidase assembly protein [Actinomycetota bacterium]|nr:cytochrome c oxidase assembly protein [Actinomycetota bacterium]
MSWSGWSIEPPLAYVALAGLLYWLGGRGYRSSDRQRLRTTAFVAGLVTIVLALDSPIDGYADQLFWVHMVQHVLLLTVAPPLILLGRPWPRMWRALPIAMRTTVGRGMACSRWSAPLRALARPKAAWVLFNAAIVLWHVSGAYGATLRSDAIHQIEHATFFFTGMLFWARVIDPGPLRPRLVWPVRIAYVVGAMVVGWGLAIALVLSPDPLYAHYAALGHRPGGVSALTDQQLAGGIMWVPGSLAYAVAVLIGFYRWLEPESAAGPSRPALT